MLKEYDLVRLILPIPSERWSEGSEHQRPPAVGDIGAIVMVHAVQPGQRQAYVVECIADDGRSGWLADVLESELALHEPSGNG